MIVVTVTLAEPYMK